MAKRLRGGSSVEVFSAKCRVSCALDAACGLSHLHNMTPRQGGKDDRKQRFHGIPKGVMKC